MDFTGLDTIYYFHEGHVVLIYRDGTVRHVYSMSGIAVELALNILQNEEPTVVIEAAS